MCNGNCNQGRTCNCFIETAPADLEEDRHNVESMGSWIIYALCFGIFLFVFGTALEMW